MIAWLLAGSLTAGLPSADGAPSGPLPESTERADGRDAGSESTRSRSREARPAPASGAAWAPASGRIDLALGRGLRFNNPYRLATPLGSSARSISATAPFVELGGGALWAGGLLGGRHGARAALTAAATGVSQLVATLGYWSQWSLTNRLWLDAHAGAPVVITPDTSVGVEAGVGLAGEIAASIGVSAAATAGLYFGAATPERAVSTIPVLSLQFAVFYRFGGAA